MKFIYFWRIEIKKLEVSDHVNKTRLLFIVPQVGVVYPLCVSDLSFVPSPNACVSQVIDAERLGNTDLGKIAIFKLFDRKSDSKFARKNFRVISHISDFYQIYKLKNLKLVYNLILVFRVFFITFIRLK